MPVLQEFAGKFCGVAGRYNTLQSPAAGAASMCKRSSLSRDPLPGQSRHIISFEARI
jgi:hypothetical protein